MFQKTTQKPSEVDRGWFTLADCAAAFDMTSQGFHKEIRPLLSPEDVRGEGKKGVTIRLRGAIDAHAARQVESVRKDADPMLAGGDSPALERYREAKAGLAEMDLQERQKSHVNLQSLNDALMRFASTIRRAGEALQRRFGNEASEIMNEAIDEALRLWQQTNPTPTPAQKP